MTTPTKKGAPISEGSRDLTVLPRTRHAELAKASGCNLNTRANQAQQWERHPQVNWKRPAAGRQRTLKRLLPPEFACALPTQRSSKTEAGNGVRPTPKLSASTPPTIAPGRFQPDRIPNKTFSSFLKASGASVPAASRGFASTTLIISSRFHWAAQMSGGTCNCFALPAISARAVSPQLSMQSVLGNCFNRQGAGRSAAKLMAVIRAHPGQNFPSLTSRGRPRQQKPTALIEHATAQRRLAHVTGSSMKIDHLPLNRLHVLPVWCLQGECKAFGLSMGVQL